MAERNTKVVLSANVAGYVKGMQDAANATRSVGSEGEKLAQTRQAMTTLGAAGVAMGALLAAGVGVAIAKYAQFDQAMSNVIATGEDARASQDALRQAALDAGASTVFSATESANAIEELAKAGLSASDIMSGGLAGSLDLAAAGGLGVADAAGIAATTLQQFSLNGSDASHVADLLAAGAGKAMGDVSDMGAALNQAGLVASQFGISVEETVGTLSAFASAGMLGSDAGTSMRTMLLRLANPTDEAANLMKDLGINAYDAGGNFIGLAGLAGELETGLSGMTQAQRDSTLALIFGQDAIRGANILLREGSDGITDWTAKVNDQGYAAETAATRLDNLAGDIEKLTGALDTAFITMGSAADGPLRALVQGLTGLADAFNELPTWMQQAVLGVGALAAALLLLGGGALLTVLKLSELKVAMSTLGVTAASTRGALAATGAFLGGPWGIALAAATFAVAGLVAMQAEAQAKTKAYAQTLAQGTNAVTESTREMAQEALAAKGSFLWLEQDSAYDAATKLGIGLDLVTEAATGNVGAMKELESQLAAVDDGSLNTRNSIEDVRSVVDAEAGALENAAAAADQKAQADEGAVGAAESHAEAVGGLGAEAESTEDSVSQLADAIRNFGSATFDTEQASISFNAALADLDAALADGAGSLDVTTEAGRTTRGAMLDVASSTNDYAASIAAMGGDTAAVQGVLESGRQKIIATMVSLGMTEEAARSYADQLISTPAAIATYVELNGVGAADAALRDLTRARTAIIRTVVEGSSGTGRNVDRSNANGEFYSYADGGFATGIYAGRAGSIHKFAEPETGWEAYISGKPSQKDRNIGIWQETGRRLGVEGFANGGMVGGASVSGSNVFSLSPEDRRLLRSLETAVTVNIGDDRVAGSANRGNANSAWRGGN